MDDEQHLLRYVYVVFDENQGFKTLNGWTRNFSRARIFTHVTYAKQSFKKGELDQPGHPYRFVKIQMVIDSADYTALRLGGFLMDQ